MFGQKPEDFTGYWTYKTVVVHTKEDSTKYKLVENLYESLNIHFKKDGSYSSFILNRKENGQWKLLNNILELRSSQGAIIEMKIIEINNKELTLKFANETFKLKKSKNVLLSFSTSELKTTPEKEKKNKRRKKRITKK